MSISDTFRINPELFYTAMLHGLHPLLPFFARREGKLAAGIRGRQGVMERLERWAAEQRDESRPLVWLHAPSVGEGLQARAVAEALRARRPDVQIAYTFFSPSAEEFARTVPADVADYLPFDLPAEIERALDALRPAVLAFNKTEVWPNLTRAAEVRGVRLTLLSATLPPSSSRLSAFARPLLRPAYARLHCVAAISQEDAERYALLGVPPERRTVMGDARFDQVWARAQSVDRSSPLLQSLRADGQLTLVAGSTWPADEERLFLALRDLHEAGHPLRMVLVPHEPTSAHVHAAEERLTSLRLHHTRLFDMALDWPHRPEVLIVDRVGVLGELYAAADLAYVGGGFGNAGLHSVLEPAAFGVPILFGPRHGNAREAGELAEQGGATVVADGAALSDRLRQLIQSPEERRTAGDAARAYARAGLGAAERGAERIEALLATVFSPAS